MFSDTAIPRLLGTLVLGIATAFAAPNATSEVRFQDPSKPGLLKINISNGKIRVHPGHTPGLVSVSSNLKPDKPSPAKREDGLRVLGDTDTSFALTASGNTAELVHNREAWDGSSDFEIAVPADTSLQIQNSWGGDVAVTELSGDISVQAMNCDVNLDKVSGGTNIEVMNGKVEASYTRLSPDKPISISSMNGAVVLRVPASSKATVRFRTHNGAILTDFGDDILKTKSEDLGGTNWGAMAGKHAAMAAAMAKKIGKEIAQHAQEVSEEVREAVHEAKEEMHEAAAKAHEQAEEDAATPPPPASDSTSPKTATITPPVAPTSPTTRPPVVAPKPPRPPRPPVVINIPAISGGKVVSGTLNDGGTSIQVTLMNGDVTFRRLAGEDGL